MSKIKLRRPELKSDLSNHQWAVEQSEKREKASLELEKLDFNDDAPIFTREVLNRLGVNIIPDDGSFAGTNLSGCENKSIFELSQSKLEKLVLWAAGFSRDIRFIAMQESRVSKNYDAQVLKDEIEGNVNHFFQQNSNLTLRVHGKRNGTSKPLRNLSPGDKEYLKIESGKLMLMLDDGEWLTFEHGHKLRIFPRPVSVDREMIDPNPKECYFKKKILKSYFKLYKKITGVDLSNREKKVKLRKINMGGGFHIELKNFRLEEVKDNEGKAIDYKKIFTLKFYFITNNGEPRNIGDKGDEYPEFNLTLDVREENGAFVVVNKSSNDCLKTSIASQDMNNVLSCVAENLIAKESKALFKLFSVLLSLYPKANSHMTQGFYSIEHDKENDEYLFGTTTFDYGSLDQRQTWKSDSNEITLSDPSTILQLVYEKLYITKKRELEPSDRLMLAQLAIAGYLKQIPTFEKFKDFILNKKSGLKEAESITEVMDIIISTLNKNWRTFFQYSVAKFVDEETEMDVAHDRVDNVVGIARKETNEIIQSLLSENQYKSYSAEAIFGKMMWGVMKRSDRMNKVEGEIPGYDNVYEYKFNNNTAIILDQGDFQIGFLVRNGKVVDLEEEMNELNKWKANSQAGMLSGNVDNQIDRFRLVRKIIAKNLGLIGLTTEVAMRNGLMTSE